MIAVGMVVALAVIVRVTLGKVPIKMMKIPEAEEARKNTLDGTSSLLHIMPDDVNKASGVVFQLLNKDYGSLTT